jgi:hypothetical protein
MPGSLPKTEEIKIETESFEANVEKEDVIDEHETDGDYGSEEDNNEDNDEDNKNDDDDKGNEGNEGDDNDDGNNDNDDGNNEDDSDNDDNEDDDEIDEEFENDCNSLDHIVPGKCYSDLGEHMETSIKVSYLTKVGELKKLAAELKATNYDSYLDKYGKEFKQNGKLIRPWERKKCISMLNKIEQLLVNEREERNIDDIVKKFAGTGLDILENFTGGAVKIPFTKKKFPTRNLSTIYHDATILYKREHRDLTNKFTMGYRPTGAISFGIKFILDVVSRPLEDDSEEEEISIKSLL